jgi:predicted NUDIX family NTP pyrophosphohydrolase
MPKSSAGILPYRHVDGRLEVLLVHPGGPFWAKKDAGAWSIAKGEYDADEDPLQAARREFEEETGHPVAGPFLELGSLRQPGGKVVSAWATELDWDPSGLVSNTFTLEWPPRSGRTRAFPEVDRAQWFGIEEASRRILAGQLDLLRRLQESLPAA